MMDTSTMHPQTDQPRKSGFQCHACEWGERVESHGLMDIETLISHGHGKHHLQQSQLTQYLIDVKRAHRPLVINGGAFRVSFGCTPQYLMGSSPADERLIREPLIANLKDIYQVLPTPLPIQMNALDEQSFQKHYTYLTPPLLSLNNGDEFFHEKTSDQHPVVRLVNSNNPGNDSKIPLTCMQNRKSNFLALIFLGTRASPFLRCAQWVETGFQILLTLSNFGLDVENFGPYLLMEAVRATQFDCDLICLPDFATQVHEHEERYHKSPSGINLKRADNTRCTFGVRESDGLQVSPERLHEITILRLKEMGKCMKRLKDGNNWQPTLASHNDFGEAGEYMDMWEMK